MRNLDTADYNQQESGKSIELKSNPDLRLYRLRNRFSVLLANSRRHLSSAEFVELLKMQLKGDLWLLAGRPVTSRRRALARRLDRMVDGLMQEMEEGEFSRTTLWNACRQYSEVFGGGEGD